MKRKGRVNGRLEGAFLWLSGTEFEFTECLRRKKIELDTPRRRINLLGWETLVIMKTRSLERDLPIALSGFRLTSMTIPKRDTPTAKFLGVRDSVRASLFIFKKFKNKMKIATKKAVIDRSQIKGHVF